MNNNNERLTHGRTSVFNLNYHIVWGTKYRNDFLCGEIGTYLKIVLIDIARERGFKIRHMEIGKENDHIHLLVSAPPKLSVSVMVKWLKGISAVRLFDRYENELKKYYWKKEGERHLWSGSFYVESIGAVNEDAIAKYIEGQRTKEERLK
jgi:putative transposase